jgi:hypothetical protein
VDIRPSDSYNERLRKLTEAEALGHEEGWKELFLPSKEVAHHLSELHLDGKYGGKSSCDKIASGTLQCRGNWPVCGNKCLPDIPFCLDMAVSGQQLIEIRLLSLRPLEDLAHTVPSSVPPSLSLSADIGEPFLDSHYTLLGPSDNPDPWLQPDQKTWGFFIFYQNNLNVFKLVLNGFQFSSRVFLRNLVVIDNSKDKEAYHDTKIRHVVKEVIRTPHRLSFPQLHNYIAGVALERNLEFYFWAHSDNYPLASSPTNDFDTDVMNVAHRVIDSDPDWGQIFYAYDHFAVFRTIMAVQVPCDLQVPFYGLVVF